MNREPALNRRRAARPAALSLIALAVALAAGCTGSSDETDDRLSVVTSTNVWGDVAAQVGGDLVDVTSIVSDPAADPHSYEASARAQLALSNADVVVVNGGGYDDFALTMLDGLETRPLVVDAVEVSEHDGDDRNEHVWYDLPTVAAVADEIAADLSQTDPANADTYSANAEAFTAQIDALADRTQSLAQTVGGRPVAVTEPVPGYLLDALGLVDQTPPQFATAVEDETDVPAIVMRDTLALFTEHLVDLLVYNDQTSGPQTEQVRTAADDAQIPVVAVTETLPDGQDYVTWMGTNLDALAAALGVAPGTPTPDATDAPDPASTP